MVVGVGHWVTPVTDRLSGQMESHHLSAQANLPLLLKHHGLAEYGPRSVGKTWLGNDLFAGTTGGLASSLAVLVVLWIFCWWIYRPKLFIRI